MKKLFIACTLLFLVLPAFSQKVDILHYRFEIGLSDSSDQITGKATIQCRFVQPAKSFVINLAKEKGGKGMKILRVVEGNVDGAALNFIHEGDNLTINFNDTVAANAEKIVTIFYSGIPADGLIISKNKYGDRTFFSDNWPNRAHQWIPCNDVPSDKASVEFIVTAPAYYQVISNGLQVEETNLADGKKRTHWKEDIAIPTKVMVIGAARFSVARVDSSYRVPVTAWVYPQDSKKGNYDYAVAQRILQFFENMVGPYPFKKLANVQSKTIFGGMENASAIFYAESTVTGDRKSEDLIAHEIVHQWFGNTATEKNFAHLWLSEGFATYLTNYYWQQQYGNEEFSKKLMEDREQVIQFSRMSNRPVVDSLSPYMDLLNANSYQKGGWVLHMLRNEVGDSSFRAIVKTYYDQYKGSNADTRDFQRVAETVAGKKLDWFFDQWLFAAGLPRVKGEWRFIDNKIVLNVLQNGEHTFRFPLEIGYTDETGKLAIHKVLVSSPSSTFEWEVGKKPAKLILDPNVNLLFTGTINEGK